MKLHYLILFLSTLQAIHALVFTAQDVVYSITQIILGTMESAPGPLRPQYVFTLTKNAVVGLPAEIAFSIINEVCSAVIAQGRDQTPEQYEPKLENIKFQFRTACDKREYPIEDPSGLADDPDFDPTKMTVIMATGWTTTVNNERHDALAKAYNCRGDTNYLALDVGEYTNTLYSWSAQNTKTLGEYLAVAIQKLLEFIKASKVHLMGHSLGAQIVGTAARTYSNLTGNKLPYVTGLDPAFPCFNEGEELTVISASDADFVDIIHTDPGVAGQPESYGDIDFYVGGKVPIQNACHDPVCSHEIVIPYYVESIYPNNGKNFLSVRCNSLNSLQAGRCNGVQSPVGFAVRHDLEGTYMLEANAERPYGKMLPQTIRIRIRQLVVAVKICRKPVKSVASFVYAQRI